MGCMLSLQTVLDLFQPALCWCFNAALPIVMQPVGDGPAPAAGTVPLSARMAVFCGCQNTKLISSCIEVTIPASLPCVPRVPSAAALLHDKGTGPPVHPTIPHEVRWSVSGGHYGYGYSVVLRHIPQPQVYCHWHTYTPSCSIFSIFTPRKV